MGNPRLFRVEGIIGEDTISEDLDVFFDKLIASYDIEEYIGYRQMDLKPCVDHASREFARTDHATAKEDSIPYQQDGSLKSPNKAPEQYNTVNELFEKNDNTNIACGFQDDNNSSNKRKKKKGSCNSDTKKRSRTVHDERQEDKQMLHDTFGFASLETAGTNWECGVRRSSRIKSRPLEFWRGEREGRASTRIEDYESDEKTNVVRVAVETHFLLLVAPCTEVPRRNRCSVFGKCDPQRRVSEFEVAF
ncbi:unnamed protein product [Cochlearia groenlandica]